MKFSLAWILRVRVLFKGGAVFKWIRYVNWLSFKPSACLDISVALPTAKDKHIPSKYKYLDLENEDEMEIRKLLPNLSINQGGDLNIAEANGSIKPEDGLWDIQVKRVELFRNTRFYTQNMGHKKDLSKMWGSLWTKLSFKVD